MEQNSNAAAAANEPLVGCGLEVASGRRNGQLCRFHAADSEGDAETPFAYRRLPQ